MTPEEIYGLSLNDIIVASGKIDGRRLVNPLQVVQTATPVPHEHGPIPRTHRLAVVDSDGTLWYIPRRDYPKLLPEASLFPPEEWE